MVKLRKYLRGEAESSVSAMMMTSKNLELIMKTLHMRFGRPELIIDIILSKISAIPHMKELNIDKLISFSNESETTRSAKERRIRPGGKPSSQKVSASCSSGIATGSVASPVIQATWRSDLADGLRSGGLVQGFSRRPGVHTKHGVDMGVLEEFWDNQVG
ncbi:hypothetical protein JTB14_035044 [Gonioctena quinquepunctata]|nr:hypothetical protein JTB14_035044 [Gonioctena quinquepunctata]